MRRGQENRALTGAGENRALRGAVDGCGWRVVVSSRPVFPFCVFRFLVFRIYVFSSPSSTLAKEMNRCENLRAIVFLTSFLVFFFPEKKSLQKEKKLLRRPFFYSTENELILTQDLLIREAHNVAIKKL
jgi:hypothetical protein